MKLSKLLLTVAFGLLYVDAQANSDSIDSGSEMPAVDTMQSEETQTDAQILSGELKQENSSPKIANFSILYTIDGNDDLSSSIYELENEEQLSLSYTFKNSDDIDVDVVALGGILQNALTGEITGEFSRTPIGPINVPVNLSVTFNQNIDLSSHEGNFYMTPHVYVLKDDSEMRVATNPTLLKVLPPRMSFLDPRFLSIQLFIVVLIGLSTYYITGSSSKKNKTVRKETTKNAAEWLPEMHKKSS